MQILGGKDILGADNLGNAGNRTVLKTCHPVNAGSLGGSSAVREALALSSAVREALALIRAPVLVLLCQCHGAAVRHRRGIDPGR